MATTVIISDKNTQPKPGSPLFNELLRKVPHGLLKAYILHDQPHNIEPTALGNLPATHWRTQDT